MLENISRCSVKLKRELISNGKRNKSKSRRPTTNGEALVHPGHPRSETLGKNGSQAAKRSSIQAGREARSPRGPTTSNYLRIEKDPKCKIKIRKTTRKQHATKARTNFPRNDTKNTPSVTSPVNKSHDNRTCPSQVTSTGPTSTEDKTQHKNGTHEHTTRHNKNQTPTKGGGEGQNNFLESNPI